MAKKGTEEMNKRVQKTIRKPAATRKPTTTKPKTPTASAANADANGWALVPLEVRSLDWLRGILTGRGVHFARRIVTEAGKDWRTFEETARAVLSGEIVPPTLAEVRAFLSRERARLPSLEELERMEEPPKIEPEEPWPETWLKLNAAEFGFIVYGWFYQLAGEEGREGADEAALAKIVEDAAPLFADYCGERLRDEIKMKQHDSRFRTIVQLRNEAKTEAEWKEWDEELVDFLKEDEPGLPGERLQDGLYSRAMDYLQRRLAALLPAACDGRPAILTPTPELAELRGIRKHVRDVAATAPFLLSAKERQRMNLAKARNAARPETRRTEEERAALSRALDEVQRRIDMGLTASAALEIVARKYLVPSRRARAGVLSKEGLRGAWKKRKAEKKKRDAEALAGAALSSPGATPAG